MKKELLARIDIGKNNSAKPNECDCVLLYQVDGRVNLVVTCRDNGDAEVYLNKEECEQLQKALHIAIKQ